MIGATEIMGIPRCGGEWEREVKVTLDPNAFEQAVDLYRYKPGIPYNGLPFQGGVLAHELGHALADAEMRPPGRTSSSIGDPKKKEEMDCWYDCEAACKAEEAFYAEFKKGDMPFTCSHQLESYCQAQCFKK